MGLKMFDKKIYLCGFMASGKTTVGNALSKKLNIDYVDTDELLVETYGQSISDIFEKYGEDYFRDLEHNIAKKTADMKCGVVSTGGGMLTFDRNGEILKKSGIIICLVRDFDVIYQEIKSDKRRPLAQTKTKAELRDMYEKRISKYQKYADYTVVNSGSIDDCVKKIMSIIDGN